MKQWLNFLKRCLKGRKISAHTLVLTNQLFGRGNKLVKAGMMINARKLMQLLPFARTRGRNGNSCINSRYCRRLHSLQIARVVRPAAKAQLNKVAISSDVFLF